MNELDIEKRLTKLETDVGLMRSNELPHIQQGVDKNSEKADKILWWIIGGFTSIFLALLIHGLLTYLQVK